VIDAINIISTFIKCGEKVSEAEKACGKMQEAEQQINEAKQNVTDFENLLKTGVSLQ